MSVMKSSLAAGTLLLAALWAITTAGAATEVVTVSSSTPPCWFCFPALRLCTNVLRQQYQRIVELTTLASAEFLASTVPDFLPGMAPLMRMAILLLALVVIPAYLCKLILTVRQLSQQQMQHLEHTKQQLQQQIEHLTTTIVTDKQAQQQQIEHLTTAVTDREAQQQQIEHLTTDCQVKQQKIEHLTTDNQAKQQKIEHLTTDNQAKQRKMRRLTSDKLVKEQQIKHLEIAAGVFKHTITAGDGGNFPEQGQSVVVDYTATLLDGTKVFSTHDNCKAEERVFKIGDMSKSMRGLELGISLMSVGEHAVLTCPADYAYGPQGLAKSSDVPAKRVFYNIFRQYIVPPYATVKYDVELIKVKNK